MIRPARPADLPAIAACAEAAFGRWVAAVGRPPAPMLADHASLVAAGQVHVACDAGGALQGYVVFYPLDAAMELDAVAVLPALTGRGIGKALIRHCEAAARAKGLARVTLATNQVMTENLQIYPALGYRETGRGIQDGYARVFFCKELT